MGNKKIGVSIVNYNASEKVIETLSQIGEYSIFDDIVIVDNCSTDNSWERLQMLTKNSKIILIKSEKNGGYSYGNNLGCKYLINECKADYILVMSPANTFKESCIVSLVNAMEKNKEYAVLAPVMKDENGKLSTQRIAWHHLTYMECFLSSFVAFRKYYILKNRYTIDDISSEGIMPVDVVQGSLFLVNAVVLKEIDYWDEDMFLYNEENVLSSKINKLNYCEGILVNEEYRHVIAYSCKKELSKFNNYKNLLDSQYIYVKKYLNVSKGKLKLLKYAHKYSLFEKKVIEAARSLLRK